MPLPLTRSNQALQYAGLSTRTLVVKLLAPSGVVMSRGIHLESLEAKAPALSQKLADSYAESCIVCLDLQQHGTGVNFEVDFDGTSDPVQVVWNGALTDRIRKAHGDHEERVGKGACAVALLLLPEFAGLYAVEQSLKWNGFDYYLSPESGDERLIFNHTAVLEVSGIQAENAKNTIESRVNRKVKRVDGYKQKPGYLTVDLPTYYCVVEFSTPKSKVVLT